MFKKLVSALKSNPRPGTSDQEGDSSRRPGSSPSPARRTHLFGPPSRHAGPASNAGTRVTADSLGLRPRFDAGQLPPYEPVGGIPVGSGALAGPSGVGQADATMPVDIGRQIQEGANASTWRETLAQASLSLNTIHPTSHESDVLVWTVEDAIRNLKSQAEAYADGFRQGSSSSQRPNFEMLHSDAGLIRLERHAADLKRSGKLSDADFDRLTSRVLTPLREGIRSWPGTSSSSVI